MADIGTAFGSLPEGVSQTPVQEDMNRSTFLHRLVFLGIDFAKKINQNQDGATWRESWVLSWSPEVEIQVVESVLKGETIELAAAFLLKERLAECKTTLQAAQMIFPARRTWRGRNRSAGRTERF